MEVVKTDENDCRKWIETFAGIKHVQKIGNVNNLGQMTQALYLAHIHEININLHISVSVKITNKNNYDFNVAQAEVKQALYKKNKTNNH